MEKIILSATFTQILKGNQKLGDKEDFEKKISTLTLPENVGIRCKSQEASTKHDNMFFLNIKFNANAFGADLPALITIWNTMAEAMGYEQRITDNIPSDFLDEISERLFKFRPFSEVIEFTPIDGGITTCQVNGIYNAYVFK